MTAQLTNTPGIPPLTQQERTYVEAALEAMQSLKKTFEFWMAIGQGLKALRDKAGHLGGKFTFDRLREREGLGPETINKTRVSRLLTILEQRTEVERWRARLSDKQRFDWASPEAVWNHCPLFHPASGGSAHAQQQRPSRTVELERVNAELQEENHKLKQRDGSLFDYRRDSLRDIASTLIARGTPGRAEGLAREILAQLKAKKMPAG
jgi:hypothetical protein